jgi:hypothetical protein
MESNLNIPHIEFTFIFPCKNMCKYCPQSLWIKSYKGSTMMTMETFQKCLDNIPSNTIIHLAGFSEIFFHPQACDFILEIDKRGHKIYLFTTFENATIQQLEMLNNINFEQISIHAPDKIGFISKNEDIFLKKLDYFVRHHEKCKKLGIMSMGELSDKLKCIDKAISHPKMNNVANQIIRSNDINLDLPTDKILGEIIPCDRLYQNVVLPNGDVSLCCMDYGLKHIIGNLLTTHYNNLDREKIKLLAKEYNNDLLCRNCHYARKIVNNQESKWENLLNSVKNNDTDRMTLSKKFKLDILYMFENSGMTITEISCHHGNTTKILSKVFKKVYAIDINEESINKAKENCKDCNNIEFIQFDISNNNWDILPKSDVIIFDCPRGNVERIRDLEKIIEYYSNPILILTDYGHHNGIIKTVLNILKDKIKICGFLGENPWYNVMNGHRYLIDREGVICNIPKKYEVKI